VLTVLNEKRRDTVKNVSEKKKFKPLDVRKRKTRAYRKKLTKH
jgi:large subunit ribosomal protein L35e